MKVEAITDSRWRIWLSDDELRRWGIRYPAMGKGRRGTDRLLRRVLAIARRKRAAGKVVCKRAGDTYPQVTVEAIPVEGGCVLLVTDGAETACPETPLVYRVCDTQALFTLAEKWCLAERADGERIGSALYEDGDYVLILYPTGEIPPCREALLTEYAVPIGTGGIAAAAIAEYGRLLTAGDALGRLVTENAPDPPVPPDLPHRAEHCP